MAELRWVVNAPGYKIPLEPGADFRFTGRQLAEKGLLAPAAGFWQPAHSDWTLPACWQLTDPAWHKNALLIEHVLYRTGMPLGHPGTWTFASGLATNDWHLPYRTINYFNPDDEGIRWVGPAALGTQPHSVNFAALGAAAGVTLPTGIGVAGATSVMDGNVTPHLVSVRLDEEGGLLCFGFGDLALLWYDTFAMLLRCTDATLDSLQTWELLGRLDSTAIDPRRASKMGLAGMLSYQALGAELRRLTCVGVGWEDLHFYPNAGAEPWIVPVRDEPSRDLKAAGTTQLIRDGKWWFATWPGHKGFLQVQTTGFRDAVNLPLGTPLAEAQELFNLTQHYSPTLPPQVYADGLIHRAAGAMENTSITSGVEAENTETTALIRFQLVDEAGAVWTSDGTHFRGAFRVQLEPGGLPGFMPRVFPPQFREVMLKFDPKLADIPGDPLPLGDEHVRPGWTIKNSLHDPEAFLIRVPLTTLGAQLMRQNGYDERHDIPLELREYEDEEDLTGTLRAAGWIGVPPDTVELVLPDDDPDDPMDNTVILARGLLLRADEPFMYTPELVDPANSGDLKHEVAVRESLLQAGFDVDDAAKVQITTSALSDVWDQLPGGASDSKGSAGAQQGRSPYAPDAEESKLRYVLRIRDEWSLWLLYHEATGLVVYTYDPVERVIDHGVTLNTAATFYRTTDAAAAAGVPGQVYRRLQRYIDPVLSNIIKIIPCDPDLPIVLCRDHDSVDNPDSENYVGYYVRPIPMQPKFAVDKASARHVAVVALRRARRKRRRREYESDLPTWRIGQAPTPAGIDVGSIVDLDGTPGQLQVTEYEMEHLGHDGTEYLFVTRFKAEKVPTAPVFEASADFNLVRNSGLAGAVA